MVRNGQWMCIIGQCKWRLMDGVSSKLSLVQRIPHCFFHGIGIRGHPFGE